MCTQQLLERLNFFFIISLLHDKNLLENNSEFVYQNDICSFDRKIVLKYRNLRN